MAKTPTGRTPSQPVLQNIPIHTEEGDRMRDILKKQAGFNGIKPAPRKGPDDGSSEQMRRYYDYG